MCSLVNSKENFYCRCVFVRVCLSYFKLQYIAAFIERVGFLQAHFDIIKVT